MRQFYCKMQQLLQNEMILSQNATVITKCKIYYKIYHNTNFDLSTQEKVRSRPKINNSDKIYRTHIE